MKKYNTQYDLQHDAIAQLKKFILIAIIYAISIPVHAVSANPHSAHTIEPGDDFSIARGGRLYDKWFKENVVPAPKHAHPSYPDNGKYQGKKGTDWRCKECHGWDYQGKQGHYKSGKHYSGIVGIIQAKDKSKSELMAILGNSTHQYTEAMLSVQNKKDLVNFIQYGSIDMTQYIDPNSNLAKGDAQKGKNYFETLCATCHGLDSHAEDMPDLAKLSRKNPWEVMHKILYGQPAEEMPALLSLSPSITQDIITYLQSFHTQ